MTPPAAKGKALEVLDRTTGELIDVRAATTDQLVTFTQNAAALIDAVREAVGFVEDELVDRMDATGLWTHRVRLGDVQIEVKAPSPTAGTTTYDVDRLEKDLRTLVDAGVIARELFGAAIKRVVTAVVEGHATDRFEKQADRAGAKVTVSRSVPAAAIKRLEAIGNEAIDAAIAAAKVKTPTGRRRPSFKVKTKAGVR